MRRPSILILAGLGFATLFAPAPITADNGGAVLYDDTGFRGRSVSVRGDVSDLGDTPLGNDRASSIRVDRGCRVTLFADSRFRGRSEVITDDVADLRRTSIGNDRASSLRVDCHRDDWDRRDRDDYRDRRDRRDDRRDRDGWNDRGGWSGQKGVVLFEDADYRGRSTLITRDMDSLRHLEVGNDRASSIRVAPGCQATLHSDERFKGRAEVLDDHEPDLGRTRVGNDALSSIEVRCRGFGGNTDYDHGWGDGVILYEDNDFQGRKESFDRDVRDLGRTSFGNDRASSIRVPSGCVVILYEDEDFRGRSVRLDHDVEVLGRTPLGNDRLSSMRVDCWRRR
ncbi:MAG: beta/gamma crystallin-related protein [Acidobacteriota bacterium]